MPLLVYAHDDGATSLSSVYFYTAMKKLGLLCELHKQNGDTPQNIAREKGLKPVGPFRGGKHDVWEGGTR